MALLLLFRTYTTVRKELKFITSYCSLLRIELNLFHYTLFASLFSFFLSIARFSNSRATSTPLYLLLHNASSFLFIIFYFILFSNSTTLDCLFLYRVKRRDSFNTCVNTLFKAFNQQIIH